MKFLAVVTPPYIYHIRSFRTGVETVEHIKEGEWMEEEAVVWKHYAF